MRVSTNILTILLTASMVATATAAPKEKRTAAPAARAPAPARAAAPVRAAAPARAYAPAPHFAPARHYVAPQAPRVMAAPRQTHVYTAPRAVHVYSAPRAVHVYSAPRAVHVYSAPRAVHVYSAPRAVHVYSAPRQAHTIAVPRHVHAIAAPRQVHVMHAPRQMRVQTVPRHARVSTAPRQVHVIAAPRQNRVEVAPRHARVITAPRQTHVARHFTVTPRAERVIARQRTLAPVESPLMLSREVRAVRLHGYRVARVAVHPSRHVSYISGRVLGVNDRVVVIQPPAGGEVPVRINYVPTYRTVATGQTVTIPVLYTNSTYYAYQPNNVVPYVVNALVPATYMQYVPMASPLYGVSMNPWDAQAYYNGNKGEDENDYAGYYNNGYGYNNGYYGNGYNNGYYQYYGRPQYPDCSQPYYGQNYNQYYFTHQQYDSYCGTAGDPYGAYSYNNSYDYGNYNYGNSSYSPYPYSTYANYNPYYQIRDTAIVSGLVIGRSGSNVIVLTNDLQPAIINVGLAEQMGNTSGPLQVGRPIVAAGFYDPTNTLVATTVQ